MKLKNLFATAAAAAMCLLPLPGWAQGAIEAGRTTCGVLYIDPASIETVKKDGQYYLLFFAEEKYTDKNFLESLRQDESLKDAVSAIYLYMFNTFGSEYCQPASYIVDSEGKVCADLGADMRLRAVGDDKTLRNAYTMALKILERKNAGQ